MNSTSSFTVWDSSSVVLPVVPTFSYALAITPPMKALPLVEIVAIFKMSSLPFRGTDSSRHFSMRMLVTWLMPLRSATGLEPDETAFMPWFTSSWVIKVVVVVPSPALLSDFPATS